jgi:hypothetical protein
VGATGKGCEQAAYGKEGKGFSSNHEFSLIDEEVGKLRSLDRLSAYLIREGAPNFKTS